MAKARTIVRNCLTFHLNRLSPGEQEDADLFGRCLDALNDIVDEFNGSKSFLFREILTQSTPISGPSAQLGVAWPSLAPGDEILGATAQYSAGEDTPLDPITMAQYAGLAIKATASMPQFYAPDGAATVYFYPACVGQTVTLRTKQVASTFADLDTDYVMPAGYSSSFAVLLAERMAPSTIGALTADIVQKVRAAKRRLGNQNIDPAIIPGTSRGGNILMGWN